MVWHRLGHPCWRFVHVIAGAVGIFALVMAGAEAFTLLKRAGVKTWTKGTIVDPVGVKIVGVGRAFWRGTIVEVLNPKTDAIFSPSPRIY